MCASFRWGTRILHPSRVTPELAALSTTWSCLQNGEEMLSLCLYTTTGWNLLSNYRLGHRGWMGLEHARCWIIVCLFLVPFHVLGWEHPSRTRTDGVTANHWMWLPFGRGRGISAYCLSSYSISVEPAWYSVKSIRMFTDETCSYWVINGKADCLHGSSGVYGQVRQDCLTELCWFEG